MCLKIQVFTLSVILKLVSATSYSALSFLHHDVAFPAMIRNRRLPVLIESRDTAADAVPVAIDSFSSVSDVIDISYMTIKRASFLNVLGRS